MGDEFPVTVGHIAVRMDHTIVVFGGMADRTVYDSCDRVAINSQLQHTIFVFSLYIEKWRRYRTSELKQAPKNIKDACGVLIGEDIYTFGGGYYYSNQLWKLTLNTYGCFDWENIFIEQKRKNPSPRSGHCGWGYGGKLYIFGGVGLSPDEYLNKYGDYNGKYNNQLLQFNPDEKEWINLKCFGTVPELRAYHSATASVDKAWLFGGVNNTQELDLYELNMHSLTWTKISDHHTPQLSEVCSLSFTAVGFQLVLNGFTTKLSNETWIMDVQSQSWRLHSCDKVCPEKFRTVCLGINNVIIIGGKCKDDVYCAPCCVCSVMLEPESLQQLAIKSVYENQATLSWRCLPQEAD